MFVIVPTLVVVDVATSMVAVQKIAKLEKQTQTYKERKWIFFIFSVSFMIYGNLNSKLGFLETY